jgi:predicted Zn-dependent protease
VVEFPEGWLVSGGAQNVSAEAPGGAKEGTIELARQDAVKGQNPRQYVQKTLKREDLKQGEDIEVNGFKGHLAGVDTTGSAAKAAFIAVVFKGNDVYYFKGEAGEQGDPAAFEASFRATVGSFRGMQASDIQAANRQRVRVIEARPGDTYRSLAARSSLRAHGEQTLRVMNHDYPVREPRAGNPIKIVE